MDEQWTRRRGVVVVGRETTERGEVSGVPGSAETFHARLRALFDAHYRQLHRYMARLSGDADEAADVTQEAFVRLYRRGSLPDEPTAWLITVAMNLFRNERGKRSRRLRLLTPERGERTLGDAPASPDDRAMAEESRQRVRDALEKLPEREREMLLLHGEGFRYREIALALRLNEASVGTLLARARRAFREIYEETPDSSG